MVIFTIQRYHFYPYDSSEYLIANQSKILEFGDLLFIKRQMEMLWLNSVGSNTPEQDFFLENEKDGRIYKF